MYLSLRIISLENAAEFPIFCRTLSEALTKANQINHFSHTFAACLTWVENTTAIHQTSHVHFQPMASSQRISVTFMKLCTKPVELLWLLSNLVGAVMHIHMLKFIVTTGSFFPVLISYCIVYGYYLQVSEMQACTLSFPLLFVTVDISFVYLW